MLGNPDSAAIPPDVAALFGVAVMRHQAGELAKAEACYRQVLKAKPNHADAAHLLGVIVEALSSGTSIPELWFVAIAAYFPLADLPVADMILPRLWSAPMAALVTRQVWERQEERQLQASMPRLTVQVWSSNNMRKTHVRGGRRHRPSANP
jgi:hypothetical protein